MLECLFGWFVIWSDDSSICLFEHCPLSGLKSFVAVKRAGRKHIESIDGLAERQPQQIAFP